MCATMGRGSAGRMGYYISAGAWRWDAPERAFTSIFSSLGFQMDTREWAEREEQARMLVICLAGYTLI